MHDVQTDGRSQQETVSTRARASGDDDVTMTSRREERDGDVRARARNSGRVALRGVLTSSPRVVTSSIRAVHCAATDDVDENDDSRDTDSDDVTLPRGHRRRQRRRRRLQSVDDVIALRVAL